MVVILDGAGEGPVGGEGDSMGKSGAEMDLAMGEEILLEFLSVLSSPFPCSVIQGA